MATHSAEEDAPRGVLRTHYRSKEITKISRTLRHRSTRSEDLLWKELRGRKLAGLNPADGGGYSGIRKDVGVRPAFSGICPANGGKSPPSAQDSFSTCPPDEGVFHVLAGSLHSGLTPKKFKSNFRGALAHIGTDHNFQRLFH